jgi:hypothetical protein
MNAIGFRCLAPLVLLVVAGQASAVPIINGDFETPLSPAASFASYVVGGATLTGWNVVGPAGEVVSIVNTNFVQNGVAFHAESGNQWMDLTGFNNNNTEGVSQSVATIIGDVYQLSLWVGNTTGGSIFGTTSTVNVQLNGSAFHSAINSDVNTTGLSWEQYTYLFTASGLSTTLAFLNGDPGGDNSNGLDNIVLTDLGPGTTDGIPEPATLGLLGAGLIGLVGMRRKRKISKYARDLGLR